MNSVHEPGPNGDLETLPSRKTKSKKKLGARAPKLAQLAPRHAQVRAGLVVSWPGLAMSWARAPVVLQLQAAMSQRSPARPCASCRARRATRPCAPCRACSKRPSVVSWAQCRAPAPCRGRVRALLCALCCASCSPGTLYCDTVAQLPSHFGHNTLCVLRYKRPAFKPASVTIH